MSMRPRLVVGIAFVFLLAVFFMSRTTATIDTPAPTSRALAVTRKSFPLGDNGKLRVPKGVTTVIVDCGVNAKSTFWSKMESDPSVLLIGFEAQPAMCAQHPRHERFFLACVAVGKAEATVMMSAYSPTGASIKEVGDIHKSDLDGFHGRANAAASVPKIRVHVVRLDDVLEPILPDDLTVLMVKSDVQGADHEAMAGGSRLLRTRARRAMAECQNITSDDDPRTYYKDSCKMKELVPFMQSLGFHSHECVLQTERIAEFNCYFGKIAEDLAAAKLHVPP